jgi:hypothetical protein
MFVVWESSKEWETERKSFDPPPPPGQPEAQQFHWAGFGLVEWGRERAPFPPRLCPLPFHSLDKWLRRPAVPCNKNPSREHCRSPVGGLTPFILTSQQLSFTSLVPHLPDRDSHLPHWYLIYQTETLIYLIGTSFTRQRLSFTSLVPHLPDRDSHLPHWYLILPDRNFHSPHWDLIKQTETLIYPTGTSFPKQKSHLPHWDLI